MNSVKNMIGESIIWAILALAPQVANAQDHTNNVVANTINGGSQNDFNIEHQLILRHKFKQESARGWRLNQNLTYQRLLNQAASRHQTLTWWMHSTTQSRTVRECNESESLTNSNLYSERRAALEGYIDCLYENEIAKWRTSYDILSSSQAQINRNRMGSMNVMRNLSNKSIQEIHEIYFNGSHPYIIWKWYRDLLIRKWALLNPGSKAYRWLRGE